ncbi:hypothetical protein D6D19_07974 [Aureobasidium pullulans]|uniref:Extracellular membrane protein CFEM domain-containing protein n=1 Tax=Aureobasidium pullulans TaxID=5580 RepID=A0A4T0A1Q2_AURPU|nr:hypothetical protein D6D19_07974 [Aureobasidium pullulans]TIA12848.1 hypothetical protein D6C81_07401 [Aureobasidium pullulans]
MKLLIIVVLAASAVLALSNSEMPPCLSACMAPYPDSHSASTCLANWTAAISACIDGACSVSVSSTGINTRTSMFFTPSHDTACQQISSFGATRPQSMLQLRPGICQTNFYRFQSFLVSTGQNGIQQHCSLGLFEENQCAGGTREVPLDANSASTGQCWFVGGQTAHSYLSSFCSVSHTASSTRLQSSTTLIAADTTTLATTILSNSTSSNLTAGNDPATPANTTSRATTSIVVIIPSIVSVSGDGIEKKVAKKGGAAQWALVVVVFARSLMY